MISLGQKKCLLSKYQEERLNADLGQIWRFGVWKLKDLLHDGFYFLCLIAKSWNRGLLGGIEKNKENLNNRRS